MLKTRMMLGCLILFLTISGSLFPTLACAEDPEEPPPEMVKITIRAQNGSSEKIFVYKRVIDIDGEGARDSMTWEGTPKEIDSGGVSTWEFTYPKLTKNSTVVIRYFRGADRDPATGTRLESNPAVSSRKFSVWSAILQ